MPRYATMTFMFELWCAGHADGHERMVEGFADAGITAIEPFHTWFEQTPQLIGRYKRALTDNNMQVAAVDVICDLVHSSPADKARGRDALRRGLEICAELGSGIAHVAGHAPKPGVGLHDARKMVVDQLLSEHEFARRHGITLAIEDFGLEPNLLCKADDCLEALEMANGRVSFVFDVGNFEFAGEHADSNFELLYPHTCHAHVKDFRPAADRRTGDMELGPVLAGCPLGEGIVPAAKAVRMLKERGYSGWYALEPSSLLEDPVETVKRDLAVLRGWLGE